MISVVIADDHPLFRDGLRALLESLPNVEVAAEASTGGEAVEAAAAVCPDIVVMDLNMPELNGIEATRQITASSPNINVLILTMFEDDESVFAAMRAGAKGYVLKGASQSDITRAIRAVEEGEAIFGPTIAKRVLNYMRRPIAQHKGAYEPFSELTAREREIVELIAAGLNNQSIAQKLCLSHKTVRNYISNIFSKLQVLDRAEAIVRARRPPRPGMPGLPRPRASINLTKKLTKPPSV